MARMTDDELLQVAREVAREDDPLQDERWDALPSGDLSEGDLAALRLLAEHSDPAREAFLALQPLDEADRERIVDAILTGQAKAAAPPRKGALVISFPRRARRALGAIVVAGSLAAAAAAALLVPRGAALVPEYEASIVGEQTQRSGAPGVGVPQIGPGSQLDLVLRPEVAVDGPIALRSFIFRGGSVRSWEANAVIAEGGSLRIVGAYEALFGDTPKGSCELVFVVGRPSALPSDPEAVAAALREPVGSHRTTWQLVRVPVLLVDRARPGSP
ncbi:MAG: hypothetical protein ABJE95_35000 [Byssovorax sp.]